GDDLAGREVIGEVLATGHGASLVPASDSWDPPSGGPGASSGCRARPSSRCLTLRSWPSSSRYDESVLMPTSSVNVCVTVTSRLYLPSKLQPWSLRVRDSLSPR